MISVLQLPTGFPRVPGDVGCAETFLDPPQVIQVAVEASSGAQDPTTLDIRPFEHALSRAEGDVIATSCGFLAYWQAQLARQTPRPFVASALIALDHLASNHAPEHVAILTLDATKVGPAHLRGHTQFASHIHGLQPFGHLRCAIQNDAPRLDTAQARAEVLALAHTAITPKTRAIVLECANLPPYKSALREAFDLPIYDILTEIEARAPGTVRPAHL